MTKLTDTQLVLLSAASQRPDGVIPINDRLKGSVAKAVGEKLIALGVAAEQPALPPMSGWRENAEGQRWILTITPLGLAAIGIGSEDRSADPASPPFNDQPVLQLSPSALRSNQTPRSGPDASIDASGRSGTKKALVIRLLQQAGGASIIDIVTLTGWLPHTTRAALTGLRKAGMVIEKVHHAGLATQYRISGTTRAGEA